MLQPFQFNVNVNVNVDVVCIIEDSAIFITVGMQSHIPPHALFASMGRCILHPVMYAIFSTVWFIATLNHDLHQLQQRYQTLDKTNIVSDIGFILGKYE